MTDNPIKAALDRIEPRPQAEEQMLRRIQKKAARPPARSWTRWALIPAAACLVILAILWIPTPAPEPPQRPVRPVTSGSPVVSVNGPEQFLSMDIRLQLPEQAEILHCSILSGEIARMEFSLDAISYTCSVSRATQKELSGFSGPWQVLQQSDGVTVSTMGGKLLKAEYRTEDLNFCLTAETGAQPEVLISLADFFLNDLKNP